MKNYIIRTLLPFLFIALSVSPLLAAEDIRAELETVNYGEDALAYSSGIITDSLPKVGAVSHITGDNQTIGNRRLLGRGDAVYVAFGDRESVAPGELFTIYRKVHEVTHPMDSRVLGDLFKIVGVVEVVDLNQTPSMVKIHRSYSSIHPGDSLMPFEPLTVQEPVPGSDLIKTEGMVGRVVDIPPAHTLIAQSHVVHIDWGQMEGMQRGDVLEVFRQRVGHPKKILGELKVLRVGEHTSSALITKSNFSFLRGDQFVFKRAMPRQEEVVQDIPEMEEEVVSEEELLIAEEEEPAPLEFVKEGDHETLVVEGLLDHIEFDSGEARIKPEGVKILQQVGVALQEIQDKHIRVEGHTDNVEIGPTLQRKFPTNWELSNARAIEVVRFLREEAGLHSKGISNMGYAAYLPIASNEEEAGRQKNRRVEIVLYSADPTKYELEGNLDLDAKRAKTEALNLITHPEPPASTPSASDSKPEMMESEMSTNEEPMSSSNNEMSESSEKPMETMAKVEAPAEEEAAESSQPEPSESKPSAGSSEDLPDLSISPAPSSSP